MRVAPFVLLLALMSAIPHPASAADEDVRVFVEGVDGRTMSGATVQRIAPDGTRAALGSTDSSGSLLTRVPMGATLTAVAGGNSADPVRVVAPIVHLRIAYRVIGSVSARVSIAAPRTVSATSPQVLVAGNLRRALSLDARYRSAAEGGSDQSLVNGIPLPLPAGGTTAGAGHFSADLFASETPSDPEGSTVPNFHLVNPTALPQQSLELRTGAFGEHTWRATASGRQGTFGYGLALVAGGDSGQLWGQHDRDLSGFAYDHASQAHHIGGSLNASISLAKTAFSFSAIAENRNSADAPAVIPGSTPLGYGPETALPSHDLTYWLTADRSIGAIDAFFVGVHYGGGALIDHSKAAFLGVPDAFSTAYSYSGDYQQLKLTRSHKNLALYAQGTWQDFALRNDQDGTSSLARSGTATYSLGAERSGTLSYGGYAGVHQAFGAIGGAAAIANAHVRLDGRTTSASLSVLDEVSQDQESFGAPAQLLAPAQSATIDCSAGTASVGAPSEVSATHPRRQLADFSVTHRSRHGEITVGGYAANERNAILQDIAGQAPQLPSGYFADVAKLFSGMCGGAAFSPQGLLAERLVQVPSVRSREAYIAGRRAFGAFEISSFYEALSRYAFGTDPSVRSSISPGSQLVAAPLQRANLLLTYGRPKLTIAADALFVSANNADNLPGHVELMLGAAMQTGRGTLSFSIQNPFNAYAGLYTSSRYAVPITTTTGAIGTLANPLLRTWELSYNLATDRK